MSNFMTVNAMSRMVAVAKMLTMMSPSDRNLVDFYNSKGNADTMNELALERHLATQSINTGISTAYRVVVLFEFITSVNESNISIGEYHYDVLTDGQRVALVRVEDRETVAEYQLINGSWVEIVEPGIVARQAIETLNDINAKYSEWELNQVYYGALVEDYEDVDQFSSSSLHAIEVDYIPF